MNHTEPARETFDAHATSYDADLHRGLALSGENRDFFARGRIAWLRACLQPLGDRPERVLDFGCGTGSSAPFLRELLGAREIVGTDTSRESLDVAAREHGGATTRFVPLADFRPDASFDLVFTNGVFHHIPPAARAAALATVHGALKPGGLLALWENNPWNPGTRVVMWRIPFDRDAVPLSAIETRRRVGDAGFEILGTTFQFVFPSFLGRLRFIEPCLARLPLGAQYQVLSRKPTSV